MKRESIFRQGHRTIVALLVAAAALTACEHGGPVEPASSTGILIFHIARAPANVAMITVTVTGPGMSSAVSKTAVLTANGATDTLLVPTGSSRLVEANAFDSGGANTHRGDTTIAVVPGPNPALSLVLQPLTGSVPIVITFGSLKWSSLIAGSFHTCGLASGGAAYCWGFGGYGQLGSTASMSQCTSYNGFTACSLVPLPVAGGLTFASLAAGSLHSCGLASGGAAYCWGSNGYGQLGTGDTTQHLTPVAVAGGLTFASLTAGNVHTCGVTSGGAAYCWGYNFKGQLGDGSTTTRTLPVAVAGGLTFASLTGSLGGHHTCGLTSGGAAYCWGWNADGQLGTGDTTQHLTPVAVAGGLTFASLTAGAHQTCGVTSGGAAYCWGRNDNGQLGSTATMSQCTEGGPLLSCSKVPVAVAGGLTFASLATGDPQTCGVTTGGAAYCWGYNAFGQLGDGTNQSRTTPVAVLGGHTFASPLAAGGGHMGGITTGGAAYCWGQNLWGQLGDSTTTNRAVPVAVPNPVVPVVPQITSVDPSVITIPGSGTTTGTITLTGSGFVQGDSLYTSAWILLTGDAVVSAGGTKIARAYQVWAGAIPGNYKVFVVTPYGGYADIPITEH